jgi:hypothetical protein
MARAHGVEAINELAKKYSGGDRYVKLDDGDIIKVAFLDDPFAREILWIDNKTVDFDNNNPDHDQEEARMLVSWNVYDKEKDKVRVFDQGVTFYRKWLKCRDRFGLQRWYEIERDGKGKKTTYNLYKDDKIESDAWAKLDGLKLHILDRDDDDEESDDDGKEDEGRRPGERKESSGSRDKTKAKAKAANGASGGVIDANIAKDLAQRLKEMPKESVDLFLEKFAVKRIKEVPSGSTAAAVAFVETLETMSPDPPAESKAEIDPFA